MKRKTKLSIQEDRFLINGKLIYSEYPECPKEYYGRLMNARFIQGIFDDKSDVKRFERFGKTFDSNENTENLIKALPEWYQKGLRAITVGFQGGGPCFTMDSTTIDNNAFSLDGMTIHADYLARMKQVIEAADEIGMIVIVSLFYGHQVRHLADDRAVMEAVKSACNWLRDEEFTNVILEIANEQDLEAYQIHPILYDEKGIAQLLRIARRESGGIPAGCSTTGKYFAYEIAKESDVILIHGNNMTRQGFYNHIMEAKSIKPVRPIVCNEDSQALSQMGVALDMGISWGYYNNMTKQEPPTDWGITEGEDLFFATRLAESLHIEENTIPKEQQYYLQGLEKNAGYGSKRWIRLASIYPETIHKVEFYRNDKYFATAYDDPFTINFEFNWIQHAVEGIEAGEKWKAIITLVDGKVKQKKQQLNKWRLRMRKLYALYTVNNFMDIIYNPFAKPFEEENPDIKIYNIMDDSLLEDTRKYNGMTPQIASRMYHYAKAAQDSGAEGIIVTCTSVNEATKIIRPLLSIPIINIEEPVAEMAVKSGKKIGILATLPTSPAAIGRVIREKADEQGKEIEIINSVVEGAFDVLCTGDREKHDEMVRKALYELAEKVDVIAFAQISMSLLKFEPVKVPVCMIGSSGLERIKQLMDERKK